VTKATSPNEMQITTTLVDPERRLPLEIRPADGQDAGFGDLTDWWLEEREWLDGKLHEHGALFLRGFGVSDAHRLETFARSISGQLFDYVDGNSPRTRIESGVYTSTEYPPEYFISMHNELSYSARWPRRLYFCCVMAAETGGETPVADSRAILKALDPEVAAEFRAKGVRYIRNLHAGSGYGPSWQKTFQTEDRSEVERFAAESGMSAEWRDDGSLRLTNTLPAIIEHPLTGEEVWFNQADQFHPSTHPPEIYESMMALYEGREDELPQHATFGDGSEISPEQLEAVRTTIGEQIVCHPWQAGDLMVVDNVLCCHGRMPFTGPRKVLVAIG